MNVEFLGSFTPASKLPEVDGVWIAFLGRSNVGKSSLINLLTKSSIARVSKTPGRTQTLNLFRVEDKWIFGDFPGYGYARVSKQMRHDWDRLIRKFLTSENFQHAIQIVDSRHPGLEADLQLHEWLKHQKLNHTIVLTKSDKLNRKERVEADRKARLAFPGQPPLFASAQTKEG
ncbi:MAG TPA: ribosome biogenesis GTP-binding protein YihA/YsxC, partial [Acidobacteriota bacterium]|nr:ribosome biogenesis GTP-binding protein YihA/YsxC [Acidobacteriota bacterium]